MAFTITKLEILHPNICGKCKLMDVTGYPEQIFADDKLRTNGHHLECSHIHECKYLIQLFEEALGSTGLQLSDILDGN